MKHPDLTTGSRVFVEREQQEGTVLKVQHCGMITVLLDDGDMDFYERTELVRIKMKVLFNEPPEN